ncbi:hypothetical protein [Thiothrix subterranea]|uniref:hypothetical protein n=1 Tax=Thiothrix subterranea TaxID=2735563 RepID=UPI00280A87E2|nr:hypothetical protein [Thiothrix subterranea]
MSLRLLLVLATLWLGVAASSFAENSSSSIYSDVEASVYQVRVINQQTGKKTAIGSAFVVMRPDIIATNYHVVSTYINNPEGDFSLDYLSTSGNTGRLELLAVDVLHDLAVLKADTNLGYLCKLRRFHPRGRDYIPWVIRWIKAFRLWKVRITE